VDLDDGSLQVDSQLKSVGLRVGSHLALSLHSLNESSELSQWPCHYDVPINIGIISNIILLLLFIIQLNATLALSCVIRYLFTSANPKHTLLSDVILRHTTFTQPICPLAVPIMCPDSFLTL